MTAQKLEPGVSLLAEPKASYSSRSNSEQWVEVLVDCPGAQGLYTYRIPNGLEVRSGDILNVPFGAQQVGAIALRLLNLPPQDLEPTQIRDIQEVVSHHFFPASYWTLLQQVATYYYTPFIQVIRAALPAGLLARSQRRIRLAQHLKDAGERMREENPFPHLLNPAAQQLLQLLKNSKTGDYTWQYLQRQVPKAYGGLRELLQRGLVESYLEPAAPVRPKLRQAVTLTATTAHNEADLSTRQREILQVLRRQGGDIWLSDLLQLCKSSSAPLKALEQKGYLVIQAREVLRSEAGVELQPDQPKALMPAQAEALAKIQSLSGTAQVLLHGVTGSGKTEVYLQAIAPVLQQGQSALVLVPEIGLTPQLTDRFRARFGSQVCVYHSALSEGERYDTWRLMLNGTPQVVIGTRSAVFSPLPQLGLIILDEEHDPSFKQEQPAPCYHARTVAQWRSELENCPLILGSATPSLESWVNVVKDEGRGRKAEVQTKEEGKKQESNSDSSFLPPRSSFTASSLLAPPSSFLYLSLPDRIYARPLPPVEVVDMRQELQQGNYSIFSRPLQTALEELQERQQQGILFIHRRGFSTFVSCRSCGYVLDCPNCDVSLAYHHTHTDAQKLLRCHYCNHTCLHPPQCPHCGSPYLKFFGSGTQRVAQELSQQFPDLRLLRFDSDTTRTKGSHRALLTRFANGEADLLIGTQMLTKGIDLPQVTLVGVVAADGLLHLADYRASERSFQTLTQVAGRAGRGEEPGRVILQTYTPHHPVIEAVQRHDYQTFVEAELAQRSSLHYPPYGKLLLVRLSSPEPTAVQQAATQVAQALTPPDSETPGYELLGPAPATIFRVARRYRWQILLKLLPDTTLKLPSVAELRSLCPGSVSLTIDVDPLSF
jgi:primosomal protein N' (replication factor Y) (superfamily II helicase)